MIEAIAKRKSVRKFTDRPVEKEKIEHILRAAMRAPSALNSQPWEFIVIDDKEMLQKLQGFNKGAHAMPTAPLVIVVLHKRLPKFEAMGISTLISYESLGAASENLWLQAIDEGLVASWMGSAPGSEQEKDLCRLLNLPDDVKPFSVMAVGYPAEDVNLMPMNRFETSRIHYNSYGFAIEKI